MTQDVPVNHSSGVADRDLVPQWMDEGCWASGVTSMSM
jgi:hypothetical protein